MWCVKVCAAPSFLCNFNLWSLRDSALRHDCFEGSQPLPIVPCDVSLFRSSRVRLYFFTEDCNPLWPREVTLAVELDGDGECLCLPRFIEIEGISAILWHWRGPVKTRQVIEHPGNPPKDLEIKCLFLARLAPIVLEPKNGHCKHAVGQVANDGRRDRP